MDDPEHPATDTDAAEIAEWMEEDFGWALADRMASDESEEDKGDAE